MRKHEERELRATIRALRTERDTLLAALRLERDRKAREEKAALNARRAHRDGTGPRAPHHGKCAARSSAIRERSGKTVTLYVNPEHIDMRPVVVTINKGA